MDFHKTPHLEGTFVYDTERGSYAEGKFYKLRVAQVANQWSLIGFQFNGDPRGFGFFSTREEAEGFARRNLR